MGIVSGLIGETKQDRWAKNNPQKRVAHKLVENAVRAGLILKASDRWCMRCGRSGKRFVIHAHHDDYSKPYMVRFLCAKCHYLWHKQNDGESNAV